ncbi:MAG: hypothetical protein DMG76_37010, partial [Acidobacteria bacterium]
GNIKGQELANRCAEDLAEADRATRSGMARVRRSSRLPFSFLKHAGLQAKVEYRSTEGKNIAVRVIVTPVPGKLNSYYR